MVHREGDIFVKTVVLTNGFSAKVVIQTESKKYNVEWWQVAYGVTRSAHVNA